MLAGGPESGAGEAVSSRPLGCERPEVHSIKGDRLLLFHPADNEVN